MTRQGSLIVVSAPSGAGKRTVLNMVFDQDKELEYALSATTRDPREGETPGIDYVFVDQDEFCRRIESGDFVEWAEVHGNMYGTLRDELECQLEHGKDIVLEVDVQGMRSVKNLLDAHVVTVFFVPPSFEELERRLLERGANDAPDMKLRLENARAEMNARHEYDYIIVNDDLEKAVRDFMDILQSHRG